jgi:hypothetical protein
MKKYNKSALYGKIMKNITPKIQKIFEEYEIVDNDIDYNDDLIPENDLNAHEEEIKAAIKICIEDLQNNGGTYLDWGATGDDMYKNINTRSSAEEIARKFKDKGYFVYYDLMGAPGTRECPEGSEVCIRIFKRPQSLSKGKKEFI